MAAVILQSVAPLRSDRPRRRRLELSLAPQSAEGLSWPEPASASHRQPRAPDDDIASLVLGNPLQRITPAAPPDNVEITTR
eukprot:236950-Prymnesium_polylepis.1